MTYYLLYTYVNNYERMRRVIFIHSLFCHYVKLPAISVSCCRIRIPSNRTIKNPSERLTTKPQIGRDFFLTEWQESRLVWSPARGAVMSRARIERWTTAPCSPSLFPIPFTVSDWPIGACEFARGPHSTRKCCQSVGEPKAPGWRVRIERLRIRGLHQSYGAIRKNVYKRLNRLPMFLSFFYL